jgi:hypothetical protein
VLPTNSVSIFDGFQWDVPLRKERYLLQVDPQQLTHLLSSIVLLLYASALRNLRPANEMYQFNKIDFIVYPILIVMFPIICRLLSDTLVVTNVPLPSEICGLWKVQYLKDNVTHLAFLLSFMPLPHAPFPIECYLASEACDL